MEKTEKIELNRMGFEPEGKLLLKMAWPMILSMLMQAFYNVVDTYFVSQTADALYARSALSLAFPVQMLMLAFSIGTAVGMNSLISRRLGARRYEEANRAAANGMTLLILSSLCFALVGIFLSRPIMSLLSGDERVIELGTSYLFICCTFSMGTFVAVGIERIMTAQGKTLLTMTMQLTGAVSNIILDALWVPLWGVTGAAIATVVGQGIGMLLSIAIMAFGRHEVVVRLRDMKLQREAVRQIYSVGAPSIVMQAIGVVMLFGMDLILESLLPTVGVAVFGVYYKLQSVVFMPVFGLTNASMSIEGYNFGARNKKRLLKVLKLTIICTVCFMSVGMLMFQLIPDKLLGIFNATAAEVEVGVPALRIISLCFLVAAVCISLSTFFGAIGQGIRSMWISLIRQLVVLLPAAFILARLTGEVTAVWWAFPIAEVASLITASVMYIKTYRRSIQTLDEVRQA
ncbi:MAG: MATE family efflux transporter [Clostridia bacterium]|nr:MATE family efflux transporter [Clostridia bacterium]